MHQITGANIAASSSLTGNSDQGGNWQLEITRGKVNSPIAFTESVRETYTGVLEEIVVNTLEDEDDGISTGDVSLRDAINRASALPGEDSIIFDPSLSGGTITLTSGAINISDDLTIEGLGTDELTIDGNGVDVFVIDDSFADQIISVAIKKISIVNGNTGINNSEELTVQDSTIFGNTFKGIYNTSGTISITNSTIFGNTGNGIYDNITFNILKSIEIANSIIAGNANTDIDVVSGENLFTSLGGNVIGLGNAASVFTADRDIVAVEDPKLAELADNGGDTQTHLPLEGSPAIDRGINSEVPRQLDTDQRGAPRITGDRVDAGSVELLGVIQGTNDDDLLLGTDLDDTIEGLGGALFG